MTASRWRARLVVLLMIGAAVVVSVRVVEARRAEQALLVLDAVSLTAPSVPVESLRTGRVVRSPLRPAMEVVAGERVGALRVATTTADGEASTSRVPLVAPTDGIVVDEPLGVGQTLQPGQPFVTLYDPADLVLTTDVDVDDVHLLAPGMTARLTSTGTADSVDALVVRVVPSLDGSPGGAGEGALEVVLAPQDPAAVAALTPGTTFSGTVDTASAPTRADAP